MCYLNVQIRVGKNGIFYIFWAPTMGSFGHFTYIIMFSIHNQSMMKQLLSWLRRRRLKFWEMDNLKRAIYLVKSGVRIYNLSLLISMSALIYYAMLLLRDCNWASLIQAYFQRNCIHEVGRLFFSHEISLTHTQEFDTVSWK